MKWQTMFHYHQWATQKLLDHVGSQGEAIYHRETKNSFPTISKTFSHVLSVDYLWFKRLQGIEKPEWKEFDVSTVALTKQAFSELHQEMEVFLSSLSEEDWKATINFTNIKGDPFSNIREDMFFTFVNHSSYHRGQVTSFLRQFDLSGIPIDYIYFAKETQS